MANVFRIIFFSPITLLYTWILWIRHWFFDSGFFSVYKAPVPVLSVGNLELGGSGKTPMSDYLIGKLHQKYNIAYLSRGYGRSSSGFLWGSESTQVSEIGDEAFQIYSKWKTKISLAVDENRTRGIQEILRVKPETTLILLDDAMQHRKIKPSFSLQLTFFRKPFFENHLIPSGTLRDLKSRYSSANAIVFSKAPGANQETLKVAFEKWRSRNLQEKPLFVSEIKYKVPVNQTGEKLQEGSAVVCVAGLANNNLFFEYCSENFSVDQCISKPDHYRYLSDFFRNESLVDKTILTTEKDFYKLLALAPEPDKLFFLPLEIGIFPEQEFLETLEKNL